MKERKSILLWYIVGDYIAAVLAWYCLYVMRKIVIEDNTILQGFNQPFKDSNFYIAILIVPELWLLFHYLVGSYTDLYKKSRLQELGKTFLVSFFGSIIIFFLLLLDDYIRRYSDYYLTFAALFVFQFFINSFVRTLFFNKVKKDIWSHKVGFATLMIGSSKRADDLYLELKSEAKSFGFNFVGYLELNGGSDNTLAKELPELGKLNDLEAVLDQHPQIEEIIIAIESSEHPQLNNILTRLADRNITVRIIPDMYDILSGTVKMNHVIGEGFIEIPAQVLVEWQRISKRWFDVIASTLALIVSFPVMFYVGLRIWLTDKGPIFYKQERLGQYGKPFNILKFRSMYLNAEAAGPQLTTENDPRITPVGKVIRKYRLDEFPQFINVIKGDMSIVGPRAERKYFADRIIRVAPYYRHVYKVQPGITSLGMVKYGYASTVEEMVKRLKYDIIYMENMSIMLDFKIMIYTVLTVIYGRGK